jgi:hypothetical protein
MKETNIDCMKYRKSTHLAGVDVETIIAEKGNCIVTIKECYYAKGVDVSGNKTDGYFLEFVEDFRLWRSAVVELLSSTYLTLLISRT